MKIFDSDDKCWRKYVRVGQKLNCWNSFHVAPLFSTVLLCSTQPSYIPSCFRDIATVFSTVFLCSLLFTFLHCFPLLYVQYHPPSQHDGNITVSSTVTRQFFCKTNLQQQGLCFLLRLLCGNISHIFITFGHYMIWWFNHFTFPIVRSHCGNAFHQWLQLIHPCPPRPPAPHIREQQAFVWCFVPCLFLWVSLVVFQLCSFDSLTFAFLWILPFVYLFRYPFWTYAFPH